jgi:tRNA modification GTPase
LQQDDTIVAIATPPGRGGIGVVRIAGPEARAITAPMLRLKNALEPGRAILGELVEPAACMEVTLKTKERLPLPAFGGQECPPCNETKLAGTRIDEIVVTYFQKPHSYTSDDVIEISAHGSPVVLQHIVELALERGARLAEPGEFTMRAFLHGRIDLAQAEAVRDLIDSRTLYQAQVAAQQLGGSLSHALQPLKQKLIELIALLEAGIDFADDDVPVLPKITIQERLAEVRGPIEKLAGSFAFGKIVQQGLTLAIVGRPNVGKSSLFNRLVERDRAIVTSAPGTTRDLVTESIAIGGIPVQLIDTAGIRKAFDEAESIGIRKSLETLADADLVLVVLDSSLPLAEEDSELLAQTTERKTILVENKADVADRKRPALPDFGKPVIRTSAITGEGIAELRAEILRQVQGSGGASGEAGFITNLRHQRLIEQCLQALSAASNASTQHVPHEMLLLDLYAALRCLDEITGATTSDDILNLIFGTFCIGK